VKRTLLIAIAFAISILMMIPVAVFADTPSVAVDQTVQVNVTDTSDSTTANAESYPPTLPKYSIPFPGKNANSVNYWAGEFFGKGWSCTKYMVEGNFTQVNDFDAAVAKYKDPETGNWMIGIWQPAPAMFGVPNTYVWRMTCNDYSPPVLGAWRELYVDLQGPCEGSNYRIIARNDRANRPSSFVWQYDHVTRGWQTASKTIDAGERWWTNWRPIEPGSVMTASSPSTGEVFFETIALENERSCWSGVNPGVRY
jgi:hypothetical protein